MLSAVFNALQSEPSLFAWAVTFTLTLTFVLYFSLSKQQIKSLTDALDQQIAVNNTYLESLQQLADERMTWLNLKQEKAAHLKLLPTTRLRITHRKIDKTASF